MAFIPTPDAVRCAIRGTLFGQDVINTLWFSIVGGGIDQQLCEDLAAEVAGWWSASMLVELSDDYELQDVTATSQDSETAPSVVHVVGGAPGIGLSSEPGNVCLTVKFSTANRGRSGRGRNYVSGIPDNHVTGNLVSSTFANNVVGVYDLLRTNPLLSGNALWIVCSLYTNGAPRAQGFKQAINAVSVADLNVDSQRRRLTGRGN